MSVSLSEAEVHWRKFLKSLIDRGLHGIQRIVSDDHPGLKQAHRACFPGVAWQRCQFHLMQNALHDVVDAEVIIDRRGQIALRHRNPSFDHQ